jgi:phage baseplate assembly protein W
VRDDFLGTDLHLGFVADEQGRTFSGPPSRVDLRARTRPDVAPRGRDVGTIDGLANLVQALILRLQTERGELAPLGHPDYGSRHHELIGEPNTETNRNLVKLHVLSCLRQEPRLDRIVRVDVRPAPEPPKTLEDRQTVTIEVEAVVRGEPTPLSLVVPFSFGGPLA